MEEEKALQLLLLQVFSQRVNGYAIDTESEFEKYHYKMKNGQVSYSHNNGETFAIDKAAINVFEDYQNHNSGHQISSETAIVSALRGRYPDWTVTVTPGQTGLIAFAQAGQAKAELDTKTESLSAWRQHSLPSQRISQDEGKMTDKVHFGKFDYEWKGKEFIVYTATFLQGWGQLTNNYILHKRDQELVGGRCKATDELIAAATKWNSSVHDEVLVFDQERWTKNTDLWASVQNASWNDVIMDRDMKETLINDVEGFFDCKDDYKEFSVPWKRGIIFHGLPGNGKTISIKALMHALYKRPDPIPTLYVKSLAGWYVICHFVYTKQLTPTAVTAPSTLSERSLSRLGSLPRASSFSRTWTA